MIKKSSTLFVFITASRQRRIDAIFEDTSQIAWPRRISRSEIKKASLVSVAKLLRGLDPAPKGRHESSPGREPGVRRQRQWSPERAAQKPSRTRILCRPFGARRLRSENPGLTPGAIFSRPFGPQKPVEAGFATETSLVNCCPASCSQFPINLTYRPSD
jgi:hypothetical protein